MNILSVLLVFRELGLDFEQVKKIFSHITGLSHRLEFIGEKNGVKIIDDSKSTSAQSLSAALGSFGAEKNILLIAGGSDKGDSFFPLSSLFHERVKAVACIGATKKQFSEIAKKESVPYIESDSLAQSVEWLYNQSVS